MEPTVLYHDSELFVALKPAGYLSEKDESSPSLPISLLSRFGGEVYPVHRLDRETAGLMVYARNARAAAALSAAFAAGETEKVYYAVTEKPLAVPEGEMADLLFRDRARGKSYVVKRKRGGVKEARLFYRLIAEKGGFFLYEVRLFTGRTHQIRVQFASRACPLVGDARYGGHRDLPFSLFAGGLAFPHPTRGERLRFSMSPDEAHSVFSLFRENFPENS